MCSIHRVTLLELYSLHQGLRRAQPQITVMSTISVGKYLPDDDVEILLVAVRLVSDRQQQVSHRTARAREVQMLLRNKDSGVYIQQYVCKHFVCPHSLQFSLCLKQSPV